MSLTTIGTELIDAIIEEYGEIKRLNLSNNGSQINYLIIVSQNFISIYF